MFMTQSLFFDVLNLVSLLREFGTVVGIKVNPRIVDLQRPVLSGRLSSVLTLYDTTDTGLKTLQYCEIQRHWSGVYQLNQHRVNSFGEVLKVMDVIFMKEVLQSIFKDERLSKVCVKSERRSHSSTVKFDVSAQNKKLLLLKHTLSNLLQTLHVWVIVRIFRHNAF